MFGGGLQMYMYCIIRAAEDECEVKIYSDKKITWLCIKSSILPTELKVFQFSDPTQKVWIKCLQIKLRAYANISCHVFNVLNDMAETNVRFCLLIIYFILWSIYDYHRHIITLDWRLLLNALLHSVFPNSLHNSWRNDAVRFI